MAGLSLVKKDGSNGDSKDVELIYASESYFNNLANDVDKFFSSPKHFDRLHQHYVESSDALVQKLCEMLRYGGHSAQELGAIVAIHMMESACKLNQETYRNHPSAFDDDELEPTGPDGDAQLKRMKEDR